MSYPDKCPECNFYSYCKECSTCHMCLANLTDVRDKELEAKEMEWLEVNCKLDNANCYLTELSTALCDKPDASFDEMLIAIEANKKVITELKDLDIHGLLGEATLETMLVNSELSARLDFARHEIKALLTDSVQKG